MWIWEDKNWPQFVWNESKIQPLLEKAHFIQQAFIKNMSWLQKDFAQEAQAEILINEAIQTSAIEGEFLVRSSVRSSVARHLGLKLDGPDKKDRNIDGLIELLLDASQYKNELTEDRLFAWHASLFPTGYSNLYKINVAKFRLEKICVISGPHGKQTVHFEAPPAEQIKSEMVSFIDWFNFSKNKLDGILRAGIAHFYFVTIHPFDDGNGRISRALIDLALSQFENSNMRFYRLSHEIENHRKQYYDILEQSQKNTVDITDYLSWFLETYIAAINHSEKIVSTILKKAQFWQKNCLLDLNVRQKKALNLLLDASDEFVGNLNTRKYVSINKVSRATAYRELNDLLEKGCLEIVSQGRSTSYKIKLS